MKLSKPVALIIGAVALVAGMTGCEQLGEFGVSTDSETSTAATEFDAPEGSVAEAVKELDTEDYDCKEKDAESKYERCDGSYTGNRVALYGDPWKDVDENGCDTRNDILQRDLEDVSVEEDGCTVDGGVLDNPYSVDEQIQFEKGMLIQIDHIVPPGYAQYAGAANWTQEKRIAFANDPENLVASKGSDKNDPSNNNNSKGDSLPDKWLPAANEWIETAKEGKTPTVDDLPEDTTMQCDYVSDIAYISGKYDLTLSQKSVDAMLTVLSTCPEQAF